MTDSTHSEPITTYHHADATTRETGRTEAYIQEKRQRGCA